MKKWSIYGNEIKYFDSMGDRRTEGCYGPNHHWRTRINHEKD